LARLQFRQGNGLRAYAAADGLLREINNLKEFKRQGYGLGAAKICFKPHSNPMRGRTCLNSLKKASF